MREIKLEAARENVTQLELEVDQEEAVATRETTTTDPRRLESHPHSNIDHFRVRRFQKLIKKFDKDRCQKCCQKGD